MVYPLNEWLYVFLLGSTPLVPMPLVPMPLVPTPLVPTLLDPTPLGLKPLGPTEFCFESGFLFLLLER